MLQCFHPLAAYLSCFSGARSFKRDTSVFQQSHSLTVSRLSLSGMWQVQSARRLITEGAVGDAALARLSETSEQALAYDLSRGHSQCSKTGGTLLQ